ncbi:MAG: hypothetical protein EOM12_04400 [Verrucomicrobiae bacterium]|nr:hypothetical protein [Verrucomicrobiae bacterium]
MSEGIVILGAGLAGLGCARALPGSRVYEAKAHPGGLAYSHIIDGVAFDEGAHICHSKDKAWLQRICGQAGAVHHIPQSCVKNYWHTHWLTYPVQNHLHELPEQDRIRALRDIVRARIEHSHDQASQYDEWCQFQYGSYLKERFYAEYTQKYWRVPMPEMATDWLPGRLMPSQMDRIIEGAFTEQQETQTAFARFHYPKTGGFYAFFDPLFRDMSIQCNARALEIDAKRRLVHFSDGSSVSYSALASSIPLKDLITIIRDVPEEIIEAGECLRYLQLLCVNMLVRCAPSFPLHWMYVYDKEIEAARISFPGALGGEPLPGNRLAIQAEIFRRNDESMEVDRIVENTVRDVAGMLSFSPAVVDVAVPVHIPISYVIPDLNRAEAVKIIEEWLAGHCIHIMGLSGVWKYVWSDAAYVSGLHLGARLRDTYGRT